MNSNGDLMVGIAAYGESHSTPTIDSRWYHTTIPSAISLLRSSIASLPLNGCPTNAEDSSQEPILHEEWEIRYKVSVVRVHDFGAVVNKNLTTQGDGNKCELSRSRCTFR